MHAPELVGRDDGDHRRRGARVDEDRDTLPREPASNLAIASPGALVGGLGSADNRVESPPRHKDRMRVLRIMPNLRVADIEVAKSFYTEYLGLSTEEFNLGWVARYTSPDARTRVQLVTRDATAPEDAVISVHTEDVEGAYEEARSRGYEIVHPLTTERWGVRRFLVRAPDGNVINIVNHRD